MIMTTLMTETNICYLSCQHWSQVDRIKSPNYEQFVSLYNTKCHQKFPMCVIKAFYHNIDQLLD